MDLVYRPAGDPANHRSWPLDKRKLMNVDAEAIERVTGYTFDEWATRVQKGSTICARAFIWVMLRREQPSLKFDQVTFALDEVELEATDDEVLQIDDAVRERVAALEAAGELVPPEMQAAIDELRPKADAIRQARALQAERLEQVHRDLDNATDALRDEYAEVEAARARALQVGDREPGDEGKVTPSAWSSGDGPSPTSSTAGPVSSTP